MDKFFIKAAMLPLVFFLIAGCRVGPRHATPLVEMEEDWNASSESDLINRGSPLDVAEIFDDGLLHAYLDRLISDNYDLKRAEMKICEAFALRGMSAAKQLPFIDGRVAYNSAKPAGGILQPGSQGQGLDGIPLNIRSQTFASDFDAAWEIDLFGRRRREVEAASAFVCMQKASYHDLMVSLTAEFARTYLLLRREQKRLALTRQEAEVLGAIIKQRQQRLDRGLDAEFFLLDSEKDYDQLAAQVPFLEGEVTTLIYRLSYLLGKPPAALSDELMATAELPAIREAVPVGFPSDLLRRRPDIRYAERQLAMATADVGVAVADFFPRLTLTGNFGFQNLHLGQTKGEGESWGYGGSLLTPLFHGGSLRANLQRFQCLRCESFLSYEETVLKALEESESAIVKFLKSDESAASREHAFRRASDLLKQEQKRYDAGLSNALQLLERSQRALQAERDYVSAHAEMNIRLIALYKALGCGWIE